MAKRVEAKALAGYRSSRAIELKTFAFCGVPAIAGLVWTIVAPPGPLFVWNASPSSPMGLYAVGFRGHLTVGDMVIAWPPQAARRLAADRRYLPKNVPLVKRIAAVAGERICADRTRIFINGRNVALRLIKDPSKRPMPWWSGCHVVGADQVFLLSPRNPEAFDGRYFGLTDSKDIIGRGRLLWRI